MSTRERVCDDASKKIRDENHSCCIKNIENACFSTEFIMLLIRIFNSWIVLFGMMLNVKVLSKKSNFLSECSIHILNNNA